MGSYNVSCAVSKLSISGGTPLVLIPLAPVDKDGIFFEGPSVVSNEGPCAFFNPFTLPIRGVYSDYGTLEKIQGNAHTKAIEKYYGCKIQVWADAVCRPFDGDAPDSVTDKLPENLAGMWVHEAIYDKLATGLKSEFGGGSTAWEEGDVSAYLLERVGAIKGEKDKKRERYNIPYTFSEVPGLVLWSDGTWVSVEYKGKPRTSSCYNPSELATLIKSLKAPVPPKLLELEHLPYWESIYDRELAKIEENNKAMAALKTKDPETIAAIKSVRRMSFSRVLNLAEDPNPTCDELYGTLFNNPSFKKDFVDFLGFKHSLWGVNTLFMPSFTGQQCGNHHASKQLAELTLELVNKQLKDEE